jgi:hypothetical protein
MIFSLFWGLLDSIKRETFMRVDHTGYANPSFLFVISKLDNQVDDVHFNATWQREMGKRYFEEYQKIRKQ